MVKRVKFVALNFIITILIMLLMVMNVMAAGQRAKFYDFREQLIDGEIKKPITLYTSARERVKFDRLLRLKKSFMNELYNSSKERVFK